MEQPEQRNDVTDINIKEIAAVLWEKSWIIVLAGVLLAGLAVLGTKLFVTPEYESVTKMYVLNKQDSTTVNSSDLQASAWLTKDYAEIIRSRTVTESVIERLNLNLDHEELIEKISVDTPADTRIVTISVLDESPYMAMRIADEVRDAAADQIQKVMATEAVNVVDRANLPDEQARPNLARNGILAGIFGILAAAAAVLVMHTANDTIKSREDVERYLNVGTLGIIPLLGGRRRT